MRLQSSSIDIGLVPCASLADEEAMEAYCQNLYSLASYVQDWPDDHAAATAPDDF